MDDEDRKRIAEIEVLNRQIRDDLAKIKEQRDSEEEVEQQRAV